MSEDTQRRCVDCLEPMPAKARKCLKCGRFYGWRNFSGLSATTLSLLIALITVSTFAYNTWRSSHPTAGLTAFVRTEQADDLLDIVNTGEVMVAIKSIAIRLNETSEEYQTGESGDVGLDDLNHANEIFSHVSLRTVGVINAGEHAMLKVEYVPGLDYSDFVFLFSWLKNFRVVLSNLDMQAENLPAFPKRISCDYVVTYAFLSEYISQADRTLTLPGSCKSIADIGQDHVANFCASPSANCTAPSQ